jgi:hypothetical protein
VRLVQIVIRLYHYLDDSNIITLSLENDYYSLIVVDYWYEKIDIFFCIHLYVRRYIMVYNFTIRFQEAHGDIAGLNEYSIQAIQHDYEVTIHKVINPSYSFRIEGNIETNVLHASLIIQSLLYMAIEKELANNDSGY